jgi:peptidyl-prolyl cis-trans isomerase C
VLPIIVYATGVGCERRDLDAEVDQTPVLVRVDGTSLTKREFDLYLPEDYQDVLTSSELQDYMNRWIATEVLYREALRTGTRFSPEMEARLEQYRKDLIADQLVQSIIHDQATVSEEEVRAYYDAHEREYTTEYRVSHILVNTMEDAEAVKERIGKNSFVYLARRYSIDKHSGAGGDLGYLSKGNMISEFENVVFGMKKGDVSDIIETEFGYHILTITDVRESRFKLGYEDARAEIANDLLLEKRRAVYDSLITSLKQKAEIEITDAARGLGVAELPDTGMVEP